MEEEVGKGTQRQKGKSMWRIGRKGSREREDRRKKEEGGGNG